MEVGDLELLMLVNNYQQRFNEPTFNTLDDIPEALVTTFPNQLSMVIGVVLLGLLLVRM